VIKIATSAQQTVSSTPVRLDTLGPLSQGQRLTVRAVSGGDLVLGGPTVTASSGYLLPVGQSITFGREPIWAVRSTTDVTVGVISWDSFS
jgi:hypothetical protein